MAGPGACQLPERRAAGVLLYRLDAGGLPRFLLLRHTEGGHWSPPKGHRNAGETDVEAALRETIEEAGIAPRSLDPAFRIEIRYQVLRGGRPTPKSVLYLLGEAAQGEVRLSAEHTEFRWVRPEEIPALIPFENLRRVFAAAAERLSELRAAGGPGSGRA